MSGKSYVVVANQTEAKILVENSKTKELELVVTLTNEDGRSSDSNLVTDRPGSISAPSNTVPGVDTMSRKDAAEIEAERFAASVTGWLDERRSKENINHIDIIAEPSFLGKLRSQMSKHLEKLIGCTVDKDVVQADQQRWLDYLKDAGHSSSL
ncbi:host attachment protein [Alteromonas pelagimontana]|uniref:Host attachment protein n=1 Tax=Alteromonas pelagimontana TaxID=1858656 RepID=A0A6M4MDX5_9ALTE|nr:host attachment family protein [Alteromonas pelagimontana]QJR80346.1 host attachment protein [Alteromonas pelagimontana]